MRPTYYKRLLRDAKRRAKKGGVDFSIDLDYLTKQIRDQEGKCYYTGILMSEGTFGKGAVYSSHSLDRLDPGKGYVPGNVVLCCWWANKAKGEWSKEQFLTMCENATKVKYGKSSEVLTLMAGEAKITPPRGHVASEATNAPAEATARGPTYYKRPQDTVIVGFDFSQFLKPGETIKDVKLTVTEVKRPDDKPASPDTSQS